MQTSFTRLFFQHCALIVKNCLVRHNFFIGQLLNVFPAANDVSIDLNPAQPEELKKQSLVDLTRQQLLEEKRFRVAGSAQVRVAKYVIERQQFNMSATERNKTRTCDSAHPSSPTCRSSK